MGQVHKQKIAAANVRGQIRRWEDPAKRAAATLGIARCWSTGARAAERVVWTSEMDDLLRNLYQNNKFCWLRSEGARRIGVGEGTLRKRLKSLGLSKVSSRKGRRAAPLAQPMSELETLYIWLKVKKRPRGRPRTNGSLTSFYNYAMRRQTSGLPTVAQWKRDPEAATPSCPCCSAPLGIRGAWMNTSGMDEWECDGCGRNGVNEHGR